MSEPINGTASLCLNSRFSRMVRPKLKDVIRRLSVDVLVKECKGRKGEVARGAEDIVIISTYCCYYCLCYYHCYRYHP